MSLSGQLNDLLDIVFSAYSTRSIVLLLVAVAVAGLARGFSGFGAALIFVPLASSIIGPKAAAPLILIIDSFGAVGMLPDAWRKADKPAVAAMGAGALVGVPLGATVLVMADPLNVRWAIVLTTGLFLLLLMSGWRYRGRHSAPVASLVGFVSGFFDGTAQIAGPPVVTYWLGSTLPAATVRANIVLFFAIITVFSGLTYWFVGLLEAKVFVLALFAWPVYLLCLIAGSRLFGRTSETFFRRICFALIALSAVLSLPLLDPYLR